MPRSAFCFLIFLIFLIALIPAILLATFISTWEKPDNNPQLAGVRELSLSPTNVPLPSAYLDRRTPPGETTRYIVHNNGYRNHLYYTGNGKYEKVIGEVPPPIHDYSFFKSEFTDVVLPSGITTYVIYVKTTPGPWGSQLFMRSYLYALKENTMEQILANIQSRGINSLDKLIGLDGAYLDKRGNLYILTMDGTLCVIRDGQIIAKADVGSLGAKPPALPSMFSDSENTYFLIPNLFNSENSIQLVSPVAESQIQAKYKIKF